MRRVNRRLLTILTPLVAATIAAGCGAIDNDTIASVNDTDFGEQDFDELVEAIGIASGLPAGQEPDMANVRQTINVWIQGQLIGDELERQGVTIPPEVVDEATAGLTQQIPGFPELSASNREILVNVVAGQGALPVSQELLDQYALGPQASGLLCVSHILVDDVATADDLVARLDEGADFAELAMTESIDPGSGASGGDLGCFDVQTFAGAFIPEFVDGALGAEIGEPTQPVESQFGAHIILVRPGDDPANDLQQFDDPTPLSENADVDVASRYGTFDPVTGVVPLG